MVTVQQFMVQLGVVFFLLFSPALSQGASVTVRVDQTQIQEGESLELYVEGRGSNELETDFSPLQKDFQILGTSRSNNIAIINGHMETRHSMTVTLMPLRTGELLIPSLTVNGEQTAPIPIQILPTGAKSSGPGGESVFLEAELTPKSPYVQAQMLLTLRLHHTGQITEGALEPPTSPDWVLEPLGKDRQTTAQVQGKTYQVVERQYALFPQKSGDLTLEGTVFQGKVAVPQSKRSRSFFGSLGADPFFGIRETRPIRLQSPAMPVTVRPRPGDFNAPWWLPADQVILTESWSGDVESLEVGVPVTRTLAINAKGLTAAALPALVPPQVEGLKSYPDQPTSRTQAQGEWILGERLEKWAFVPTKAGRYTLPPVEIVWWNTREGRTEKATLPPHTLTVAPGVGVTTPPPPPQPVAPIIQPAPTPTPTIAPPPAPADFWPWLTGLFFVAWLVTLYLWKRPGSPVLVSGGEKAMKADLSPVAAACLGGNPGQARQALLAWAAATWPTDPPTTLGQVGERLMDPRAQLLLGELDRFLYAPGALSWAGQTWWQELHPLLTLATLRPSDTTPALPPLNPTLRG